MPIGTVVKEVEAMLAKDLPAGFLYAWAGDAKSLSETSSEVWWVLILAIVIIYMTLAAQFESLVHPITVLLALPLAAIGAFGLLLELNHEMCSLSHHPGSVLGGCSTKRYESAAAATVSRACVTMIFQPLHHPPGGVSTTIGQCHRYMP